MGAAVKCPRCGSLSQVLETRSPERRRECLSKKCQHRWSTVEITVTELGQMRVDTLRLLRIKAMLAQMEAP